MSSQNIPDGAQGGSTLVCRPAEQQTDENTLRLRLKKPKQKKRVEWAEDTVDNEHMNKKKSKCCCIYEKPKEFGESSSDTDDECDHCRGHVEQKKKNDPDHVPPESGEEKN